MLKVNKLNKTYRINGNYQIHVINETTFALPTVGIVAILGQSGSGKTTLLNSLCGMDKIDSGTITIDDISISKYKSKTWDDLRNRSFGYIFQNYNLFGNETVFKNVAISLEMLGMRNKKEIEKRVIQALKVVKMDKYKNRLAKNLSGGEQQRVSIARALAKDAKYILADEPTGNLDRKNTVIIMAILEEIAKTRLVVMVTHEKDLADRYADRIMYIKDGKIIQDKPNDDKSTYSFVDENEFYLDDLEKETYYQNDQLDIKEYIVNKTNNDDITINSQFNNETLKLTIRFIVKNNRVFIQGISDSHQVQYIDKNSLVQFIEGKEEEKVYEQIEDASNILPVTDDLLSKRNSVSLIKYYSKGFEKIFKINFGKRLVFFIFLIASFLLTLSIGLYSASTFIDKNEFMTTNQDLIVLQNMNVDPYSEYKVIEEALARPEVYAYYPTLPNVEITYVYFDHVYRYNYFIPELNRYTIRMNINTPMVAYNKVDNYNGPIPKTGEVVVDKMLYNKIITENKTTFQTEQMFIGQEVIYNEHRLKIIGFSDNENLALYTTEADVASCLDSGLLTYEASKATCKKPSKNEVILSSDHQLAVNTTFVVGEREYTIIGTYESSIDNKKTCVFSDEDNYENYAYYAFNKNATISPEYYLLSNDYENTLDWLHNINSNAYSQFETEKADYMRLRNIISTIVLIVAIVAFVIPSILLYFLMRSNMLARIKEIGIYRALGLRKNNIYKMHLGEILAITTIFSFPGWLIAIIFMYSQRNGIISLFRLNTLVVLISLFLVIGINIGVGLLPIGNLLKKTPQDILTKYDI